MKELSSGEKETLRSRICGGIREIQQWQFGVLIICIGKNEVNVQEQG
ncbi:hypothetical protein [Alkalicoccus saliphilus]|nr:hypothetical protein [Alkalicoccus saliphilus]